MTLKATNIVDFIYNKICFVKAQSNKYNDSCAELPIRKAILSNNRELFIHAKL